MTDQAPLVLRWRIHEGKIPLKQRHLRSLESLCLPDPLMGWVHERLEWAAINMLNDSTEGVLVINIDPGHEVTLSLDPVREAPKLSTGNLLIDEGLIVGVGLRGAALENAAPQDASPQDTTLENAAPQDASPQDASPQDASLQDTTLENDARQGEALSDEALNGTVWLEYDGILHASCTELTSATDTLAKDLVETLKLPLIVQPQPVEALEKSTVFLISDEFGFLPIQGDLHAMGAASSKLNECFSGLW
jgi:hypothetical protein